MGRAFVAGRLAAFLGGGAGVPGVDRHPLTPFPSPPKGRGEGCFEFWSPPPAAGEGRVRRSQEKECLNLMNKATMLLKIKEDENEQSQRSETP